MSAKLETADLRTEIRAAANIRLKEILKRRALFGNLPMGRDSSASNKQWW